MIVILRSYDIILRLLKHQTTYTLYFVLICHNAHLVLISATTRTYWLMIVDASLPHTGMCCVRLGEPSPPKGFADRSQGCRSKCIVFTSVVYMDTLQSGKG